MNSDEDISNSDIEDSDTEYDTDDEPFSEPIPVNLFPVSEENHPPNQPIKLEVNLKEEISTYLPLCLTFNARSVYNKSDNLAEMLKQIGPDLCIIFETFEREEKRLNTILNENQFKTISYYRTMGVVARLFSMKTGLLSPT